MMRYLIPFLLGLALHLWGNRVALLMCRCLSLPRSFWPLWLIILRLMAALWVTVKVTCGLRLWHRGRQPLFCQARLIEMALYPYVIALQVTPVVAIARSFLSGSALIMSRALVIIAQIVAFFPCN